MRNLFEASKDVYNNEQIIQIILGFIKHTRELIRGCSFDLLNEMIEDNPELISYLIRSTDFLEKICDIYLISFTKYVSFKRNFRFFKKKLKEKKISLIFFESLSRNCKWSDLILLTDKGILSFLLNILKNEEAYEIINTGLDCLRNFFEAECYNENNGFGTELEKKYVSQKFLDEGGDKVLEMIQMSKNDLIFEKALNIVEDFFDNKKKI